MRRLAPFLAVFAACSIAEAPTPDDGGDGDVCIPQTECQMRFAYPAAGISGAELRGSFDDWGPGRVMRREGDHYVAYLDVIDGQRIEYKFVINGTEWINDPMADTTSPDGVGGVNSVRFASCDDCPEPTGFDWRDGIMYFVFVDRFHDGDPGNNAPIDGVAAEANYQGGDLAGVLAKIEEGYFSDLGVNVLWLTAPVDNADSVGQGRDGIAYSAYHGYWPAEVDQVESRIGTRDELRAVVDAAHARDIKVVLDYVMNHVHTDSSIYAGNPDWFWPLDLGDGTQCVCGGGCDWGGDQGRRCWFEPYLADFNFTNPEARDFSVDNAIEWIRDTGVDGYRLDAVKHIETRWIVDFRARLRDEIEPETGETFYLVGETFDGDRGLIGSYVDPETMLDGQFDFPLRAEIMRSVMRREGSMADLAGFLGSNDSFYHPRAVMGTFIGNHDLPRPIHLAEDVPQFDPWDGGRSRGWENRPTLPDYAAPFERMAVAYTLLMTSPGIPLIYYGDEIGMAGGGDPDNRRPMQWTGLSVHQQALREHVARLAEIRAEHSVLRRGYRNVLGATGDALVYEMIDQDGSRVIVALNRGDAPAAAEAVPPGSYTDVLTGESISAPFDLGARSARILVAEPL